MRQARNRLHNDHRRHAGIRTVNGLYPLRAWLIAARTKALSGSCLVAGDRQLVWRLMTPVDRYGRGAVEAIALTFPVTLGWAPGSCVDRSPPRARRASVEWA